MRKELEDIVKHMDKFGNIWDTIRAIDDAIAVVGSISHSAIRDDAHTFIRTLLEKRTQWEAILRKHQKETEELLWGIGCSIDQGGQGDECMVNGVRCHRYHMMGHNEEPCNTCFKEQFKTGEYKNWTRE